jgi:CHAD domain-containing protein
MAKRKSIHWDEKAGAAQNAQRELPAIVTAYFAKGREMLDGSLDPSELHALRLLTKRLRYTLELFRPCYGPGFRARIAALRRIQQCLGEINDCVTAAAVVADIFPRSSSPIRKRVDGFLAERSHTLTAEFRRDWTEVFDAPGQERWWTAYLARPRRK